MGPGTRTLTWMLAGKLKPPAQRVELVRRDAVLARLDAALGLPLSVIASPPGFGKTTLLTQWWDALRGRCGCTVAWLSADGDDGQVQRLLADLLLALDEAGVEVGPLIADAAGTEREVPVALGLPALIDAVGAHPASVVLIVDDYHRASGSAADALLERLLRSGVPNLHLAISSRELPQLHLSELRARGLAELFQAADLAFTAPESAQLFGALLDADAHADLYARTEGWPVVSQLARLWLHSGGASPSRLHEGLSRHDGPIANYLSECVFDDLPQPLRDFLVDLSILDRFNAALADAVRARSDSGLLLAQTARFEALLVPLDAEREWFRLHLLLRQFLQRRLAAQAALRVAALHRAAADWLAERGDLLESLRQRLQAGDLAGAVDQVVAAGGWKLPLTHGIGFTANLLRAFTPQQVEAETSLSVLQAYLGIKLGEWDAVRRRIESLHAGQAAMNAQQRSDFRVVGRLWNVYQDVTDAGADLLADLRAEAESPPGADAVDDATLYALYAGTALTLGEFAEAERAGCLAHAGMEQAGSLVGAGYALLHTGQSYYWTGRWDEAAAAFEAALAIAQANRAKDGTVKVVAESQLAQLHYQRNRLDLAVLLAGPALDRIEEQDGWFEVIVCAFEVSIRVAAALTGAASAVALITRAERLAARRRFPRLQLLARAWREQLDIEDPAGRLPAPQRACAGSPQLWRVRHAYALIDLRAALKQGRFALALKLAAAAAEESRRQSRRADALQCELFAALALRGRGDTEAALRRLGAVLVFAAEHEAVRLFLDAGPGVESLLTAWLRSGVAADGAVREFVGGLLRQLRVRSGQAPQLSARELDVLRALCSGGSNKAIGRLLDLSENTVKFHVKNIFRKLNVETRTAALAAASRLGMTLPGLANPTPASSPNG
jgi:LuxR family transcriptional regulator, maltose regulon positive regulatory protein